eukprot:2591761-Amphidinium_carterae.1
MRQLCCHMQLKTKTRLLYTLAVRRLCCTSALGRPVCIIHDKADLTRTNSLSNKRKPLSMWGLLPKAMLERGKYLECPALKPTAS